MSGASGLGVALAPSFGRHGATQRSSPGWIEVCPLSTLEPDRGVAALVGGTQVAIFRLSAPAGCAASDGSVQAVDNHDPASGANVLSRGLVGSTGPVVYVASPMHKQRFDLATGTCLEDERLSVRVWPTRVRHGRVEVYASGEEEGG